MQKIVCGVMAAAAGVAEMARKRGKSVLACLAHAYARLGMARLAATTCVYYHKRRAYARHSATLAAQRVSMSSGSVAAAAANGVSKR